jgi:hypothetical protein
MLGTGKCVTCLKCGWVYFEVTREYAENEVKKFNEYFNGLTKEKQDEYYGGRGSSIKTYEQCWCGSDYKNFRDSKEGDCPNGVTMSPMIRKED